MIRIRTGSSWRHDPRLRAALGGGMGRAAAARAVVDALAVEVDGVDLAAGRAEGPLLPALEALLRAVARVARGAPHATFTLPDGELEVVIRRRGPSALLTIVALSRPSRVLAREVEVDVEELAAAALDASATFCRELAEVIPEEADRESRRLRAAARDLRRAESTPPRRPRAASARRRPPPARAPGRVACVVELADEDGVLDAYEGGRPDLGSLLAPGRLSLRTADGREILAAAGLPFLVLRDLGAAADGLLGAVRRGEPSFEIPLAHGRAGAARALALDLVARTATAPGAAPVPCPPLDLARALAEAALELGRTARARNPRQAENAFLAELEAAAAARIAQIAELAEGDRAGPAGAPARPPAAPRVPQRALGPGRLRRLRFRRTFAVDAGLPAGAGLLPAGGLVVAAGAAEVIAVARASGAVAWRVPGCAFAAAVPGAVVVARGGALAALSPRTGRALWSRALPGGPPTGAVGLSRGPLVVAERGALTGLDPGSGRTLWRLEPPGASRLEVAPFGGIAAAGADTGFVYGVDAAGRVAWRVRAPGPVARAPAAAGRACLALAEADPGAALVAIDPASGARLWEARLDLVPAGPPLGWGRRLVVGGTIGGDPALCAVERNGASGWIVAPPLLAGAPSLAAAGALLVVRDPRGAVVALGRDGAVRWSRPAAAGQPLLGTAPPAVARSTVIVPAADGLAALDARTGEIVGAIPGAAPSRLSVDAGLGVVAMDADGVTSGWRLGTHLSVV
ncbi:MAG TPA: PQQ-binding-like beta-propeller repeat protein [Anaeromyxobacter sp.]|nr:PQQ-binding-like beta-propeller repeat protein [Anaeromyxobacter sp.]